MKFNKYWFISGTIAFIVIFTFLVTDIYEQTLDETKRDHQLQQLEMAKTAAQGINYLIEHLFSDMRFLAAYIDSKKEAFDLPISHSGYFFNSYESSLVSTVFITDQNAQIQILAGEPFPDWALQSVQKLISTTTSVKDSNEYWLSPVIRDESNEDNTELFFIMLKPIIAESLHKHSSTTKYIGYLISFNALVNRFIKPLRLNKSDFAWVIDGTGRLIYHPNHEEMLFRSISDTTSECTSCHVSFDVPRSMIKAEDPAIGEYSIVGDEPPKVMAYIPIKIQNQRWILVISTFLDDITASLKEKFKFFFILGFVILGVIIFFSLLVYYMNSKRIRAEEAKRNLEQIQEVQAQLYQASKLASIGELVDTVAHEINTPAGIIATHADAVILEKNTSDEVLNALNIIKKQTHRISDYTRSLLNYSQSMPFNPEPIVIAELINECTFLLGHRFRAKKITVTKNFISDRLKVVIDRRQMEQVFINLLNNAVDAINSHGEITISLKTTSDGALSEDDKKKGQIFISIEDNGTGIPEDHLDKIFNPFFSTKSKTEGTGLGLAITKAIITRHRGKIEVSSKKGGGTKFNIFLRSDFIGSNKTT